MDSSSIGGGAYDYFVSRPHKTWKVKNCQFIPLL